MGEKYLMWYQVELQKWKWSPQHSGRVEKVGEDRQAEWGKERSDRWHRSSRGLWYRVFKHSYGPLQHFKDSFGPSQHLIASLCWHNKTAHGMTPLCSFPCQVLSCGTSFSEQSWPISASRHVIKWPWQRPFTIEPLSAPSHVKCSAIVPSSQEESWSTLASQHLIMLAWDHLWPDLCLLHLRSAVEPWYSSFQGRDGPP